jgi:hypothetical protein
MLQKHPFYPPTLIRMVLQFIFDACHEKLAEVEANIVFP